MTNNRFFKYFHPSGLQVRIISFLILIAVLLTATAVYLLWETGGARNRSQKIREVYFPASTSLLQLQDNVDRYISLLKLDLLQKDTANGWQRDQLRKESIIPGAAKLSLQKDAFSPASRLLLDSLSQTVISVEQKAEALTQWLTEHGINVSTDSASLANLASQEEMFLNPQLKQVEKLQV